jgi:hypothetical protein
LARAVRRAPLPWNSARRGEKDHARESLGGAWRGIGGIAAGRTCPLKAISSRGAEIMRCLRDGHRDQRDLDRTLRR